MWNYTPRQIQAFLFMANRRRMSRLSELLIVNAMASRGEAKAIERQLRGWEDR